MLAAAASVRPVTLLRWSTKSFALPLSMPRVKVSRTANDVAPMSRELSAEGTKCAELLSENDPPLVVRTTEPDPVLLTVVVDALVSVADAEPVPPNDALFDDL